MGRIRSPKAETRKRPKPEVRVPNGDNFEALECGLAWGCTSKIILLREFKNQLIHAPFASDLVPILRRFRALDAGASVAYVAAPEITY
jgi:hypothetical protein